jgi:hypothetical protein
MAGESEIVSIARQLACALSDFAYSRKDEDRKRIAALQFELCRICGEQINALR